MARRRAATCSTSGQSGSSGPPTSATAAETSSSTPSRGASSPASATEHRAEERRDVALHPAGPNRDRRLAGEGAGELDVADGEGRLGALVEHLQHADRAAVVHERDGHDGAGHVLGLLGEAAPEARVARDVRDGQRLTRREDVADEAPVGRDLQADDALALGARRDPEDEDVARRVEEGERRGLGLEQEDGGLDDRAQDGLGPAELEAAGDLGPPSRWPRGPRGRPRRGRPSSGAGHRSADIASVIARPLAPGDRGPAR